MNNGYPAGSFALGAVFHREADALKGIITAVVLG